MEANQEAKRTDDTKIEWEAATFDIDGFYKPKEGDEVVGRLVAYRYNKKMDKNYYLLELLAPHEALSSEDTTKMVTLEKGKIIWVNESWPLRELVYFVNQRAPVKIKVGKLTDIGGGKKTWRMKFDVPRGTRRGQPAVATDLTKVDNVPEPKGGAPDPDSDDIPF